MNVADALQIPDERDPGAPGEGGDARSRRPRTSRSGLSCRFTTGSFGLADHDRRHVKLPRIGVVRTHESTRKLARRVDTGAARIRSATVSYRAGRCFVSFSDPAG
ncbi:hypothetical protein [Saccharopolyspora hattusasensis]|uniref:hypothetical protein n=1 Tax=Saccharopolyspora hattusasensis TaxID=1128679 RepID=UPI003D993715